MTTVLDMIGKFHPLLLHLPIGILIYAYLHLGFDLYIKKKKTPVDINFALGVGALTAVLSSLSGYLLSQNGEYGGELLDLHKWLGIATAAGSLILLLLYKKLEAKNLFFGLFSIFMILLTATGHFGGSLTHGEGFLSLSSPDDDESKVIEDITKAHVFNDLVMPITKRKCGSCHNPKKIKGELLLNSLEGWKKGGKTGKFVIPGDLENSLMLTRIHLPLAEKEHMPPSGKLQLEEDEIVFVKWWVKSMSNFEEKVEDLNPPDHIMKFINGKLDASTRNVPPIDKASVTALQNNGIPAQLLSKDQPWLVVAFDRGKTIKNEELKRLTKYNENIRKLTLSKTGLNDKMLSKINKFINLKYLDISLNDVTTSGIAKLQKLEKLEILNLYGTKVDIEIFDHLSSFSALQDIYLWQTNINKSEIAQIDLPKYLNINLGQDLDVFGEVQLSPPMIDSEKVIFQDSASITISHASKKAQIHYSIDGKEPTKKSPLYTEAILLDKTSEIKAMAIMEGWQKSEVVSRSFLKSTKIPIACNVTPEPNDRYKAEGSVTLINSIKGSERFGDGKWLGFSAEDVSIIVDLGEVSDVGSISFGSLQDHNSYIFKPIGASVSTSEDGRSYVKIKEETYQQITEPSDILIKNFILNIPDTKTKYIKLDIVAQKKNPPWHPAPGADSWLFVDEIVIE